MTIIAALDIETTGLNPKKDAIIEIGVRLFDGKRIESEWTSLINPHCHIPEFITGLTGITNEMVRNAPGIQDVLDDLATFVGTAPILGHNIRFDLSFFVKYNLFPFNTSLDTYEMAAVLMPSASRYNLGALARELIVPQSVHHRALDDARSTHLVFLRLWDMAYELPENLLAEIVRHGEPLDWGGNWPFQQILLDRAKKLNLSESNFNKASKYFFTPSEKFLESRYKVIKKLSHLMLKM